MPVPTEGTVTVEKDGKVVTVPVKVDEHGGMTPSTVDLSDANIAPVTVTVVEKGTTTGIANATVTVGAQKVQAGANGEVTLRLVKNGTYNGVTASAAGYLNDTVALTVNAAGTAVSPDKIELRKTAPVAVTVTDGGNSVDGATVTIVDDDGKKHEATTGADGKTTVQGVPVPTKGTVTVEKNGQKVTVPVTVDEHGVMTPATVDLSDANITPVTVTVVEKGASPEKLISGATVTVGAQAVQTGTTGEATLRLVKGVSYPAVKAEASGYKDSTVGLEVKADGSVAPSKIELVKKAVVQSDPYLHVFVVDENLRAIVGVSVSVEGVGSDTTDFSGHAAWQLTAKEYALRLEKKGYVPVTTSVVLDVRGHDLTVVMQRVAQADPKKEDPTGPVTAVESELLAGASLYPNPAHEYTTLQGIEHAEMVSILTLSGVEVQRLAVPGDRERKLDVSSLAEGIYLVVLETRGGERRTLKLVVRR